MSATIGFGRRIGTGPELDEQTWQLFRVDVMLAVVKNGGDVVFAGEGLGIYKGVVETGTTVVFTGGVLDAIVVELRLIAKRYGQDSITLTVGVTQFVGS